uniref:Serpentine receptor class gamma n=1 Tax=Meloidogyne floridensis TaxID=298350 RepID=A0A915NL81_9BILA
MIIRSAYDFPDWLINGDNYEAYEIVVNDNGITSLVQYMLYIIIIFYAFVGLILAFRKGSSNNTMKKVYRSLILIVLINVGGYILCTLITAYILVPITSGNQFSMLLYGIFPSVLLNTASASTAPILYINW